MYKGFSIYDFCAFFITLGLILSIYVRKLWRDRTNSILLICLFITLSAIVQNSLFIKLITLPFTSLNIFICIALRNLYFISLLLIMCFTYLYMLSTMGLYHLVRTSKRSTYKNLLYMLFLVPLSFIIVSLPNKWIMEISKENGYVVNIGTSILYIFMILVLLFGIITAFIHRKYLTKVKILDCLILYPINIISIFHQMINQDYSFMMFVIVMSFYVISITTQKPENLINPILDAKTSHSFYSDTETIYLTKQNVSHIYVKIVNHSQIKKYIGDQSYIKFLRDVSNQIHNLIEELKIQLNFYYLEDSEFCIVLEDTNAKYVKKLADNVAALFFNEYEFNRFKVFPDARICVVSIPDDIKTYEYLSYFAKVFHHLIPIEKTPVYYKSIAQDKEFLIKNDIENIIKKALDNDRFKIYYQPIYNVKEGRFDSVEALLRLNDDNYGDLDPSFFISVSEISGSIIQIGDIVFRKVLSFISSSEFKNSGLKYVEVNLTLAQCMESTFVEKIFGLLNEYGVNPSQLHFEITENMEGYNIEVIENNIKKLYEAGIVFALDDYGTGYSNIKQVLALPVDIVKLDKAFVQEIDDPQMKIVIDDTITMLKNLNKKILVEGVESQETLDFFKDYKCEVDGFEEPVSGCEYIQGYYFSQPLPEEDLLKLIKSSQN